MTLIALLCTIVLCALLGGLLLRERRLGARHDPGPLTRRILFPFIGRALSQPALDATLRLARAEEATLVPAVLARVPMDLPLTAPLPKYCRQVMPLLEAVEHRAFRQGVAVDSRIQRGRSYRHALRELLDHERFDRVVVAADTVGTDGFCADDIGWLLKNVPSEILVVRPAHDRLISAPAIDEIRPATGTGRVLRRTTATRWSRRDRRRPHPRAHRPARRAKRE